MSKGLRKIVYCWKKVITCYHRTGQVSPLPGNKDYVTCCRSINDPSKSCNAKMIMS